MADTSAHIASSDFPVGLDLPLKRALGIFGILLTAWMAVAATMVVIFPSGSAVESDVGMMAGVLAAQTTLNGLLGILFIYAGMSLHRVTTGSPSERLFVVTKDRRALAMGALGLIVFALMVVAYTLIKVRIAAIAPYSWDPQFAELDRILFFGRDPWTVFAGIYELPWLVMAMDWAYENWAFLLAAAFAVAFFSASRKGPESLRLPLALAIAWLLGGNLLAIAFSSAGPCYYGFVTWGADPFAAQLAILDSLGPAAESARAYQHMLWQSHVGPGFGLGGISAMPSMHCTTSFLFVFGLWHIRASRIFTLSFAALIWFSSVMLAWHYVVDGALALLVAAGSWWLAVKLLAWAERSPILQA